MSQNFYVSITQQQANLLQRLGMEVDSKMFLIKFLSQENGSSEILKKYIEEYEKAFAEFQLAKQALQTDYLTSEVKKITGLEHPEYKWSINDYNTLECKITVLN